MDGRLVSDLPSDNEGAGGDHRPSPRFAYTEKFEKVFPYYLSIGMTAEQYWEQDCTLVKAYRKAAQIRQDLQNQQAWLQGMYIYEALCDVSPAFRAICAKKPTPYIKEPYDLHTRTDEKYEEEKEKKRSQKAKAYMEMFMAENNKRFREEKELKEKGGGVNG